MTVHLSLHGGVSSLLGWGRATPPKGIVRIELRDPGQLVVVRLRHLRDQDLATMSIANLRLNTNNAQVETGGGYSGGGFGIRGLAVGMATAGALNAISRQRYEHTMLTARETLPNGARRQMTFALATLSESQLRDELAAAIEPWADGYIAAIRQNDPLGYGDDIPTSYAQIDRMCQHGLLTDAQALALNSHASRPFVTGTLHRLDAHQVTFPEARELTDAVASLERKHRLDGDQARQLHDRLLEIPVPQAPPSNSRIEQLQALAELRKTGTLTEDEFQTEKTRILREPS